MIDHENFDLKDGLLDSVNGWQVKSTNEQNETKTQSPSLEQVYPSNEEDK